MIASLIPAALLFAGVPALGADPSQSQVAAPSAQESVGRRSELPSAQSVPLQIPAPAAVASPSGANSPPAVAAALTTVADPERSNEIVVTAPTHNPADPLEKVNLKSFEVTQKVDDAITAPLAHGYEHAVPRPVRMGVHNFLDNLHEPVVFINFLLQHKVGKAAETMGRFAINTTVGVAGVIDVAKRKPFHLPRRPNGFADSFGFYGVKPGAFLFLPLIGPTTVRDLVGSIFDRLLLPFAAGKPFSTPEWAIPTGTLHSLDRRIEFDDELARQRASVDPYTAARQYYLTRRQAEIDTLHRKATTVTATTNDHGD